jgi:hypothetical protein
MPQMPLELVERANDTTQSLLRGVAEERPIGTLGPEFVRRLRARVLLTDEQSAEG